MVLGSAGTRLRLTLASPCTLPSQHSLASPRSILPPSSTLPSPSSLVLNENEASSRRYVTLVRQHLPKEGKDTAGERS